MDIKNFSYPIRGMVKQNMCFRECAKIIKIAEETGCVITFITGDKKADTKSLLALVKLELTPGQTVVIKAEGENFIEAYKQCMEVIGAKITV